MTGEVTADGAFGLLSNEIRVGILRAVASAQNEKIRAGIDEGRTGTLVAEMPFSDIYERVEVDNTSKFSYHLGELTGTFLRKGENGYSFTHAGEQIIRFIVAENYLQPLDFGPLETNGCCLYCGESALEAMLHDQFFMIQCSDCERPVTGYMITPAQTRCRTGTDLLESLKYKQATDCMLVQQGVCPACAGRVDTEVAIVEETGISALDGSFVTIDECQQCLRIYSGLLTYAVAYHPSSVAFHWDHGIDLMQTGLWEFHHHVREGRWTSERTETDSTEYRVILRQGSAALRVSLDETGEVVRTERVRRRTID
ncbi:DUF7351 domain-containing protein [Natronorarus salvus]|uniref:DUF7351 domain-containing protein n=1 Tax=Natronorarus salvus TaxID=3117733 RepID=UPI002F26D3CE